MIQQKTITKLKTELRKIPNIQEVDNKLIFPIFLTGELKVEFMDDFVNLSIQKTKTGFGQTVTFYPPFVESEIIEMIQRFVPEK